MYLGTPQNGRLWDKTADLINVTKRFVMFIKSAVLSQNRPFCGVPKYINYIK